MIWLEGSIATGEDADGNAVFLVEVGPGMQFGVKIPHEARDTVADGLRASRVIRASANAIPVPGGPDVGKRQR